MWAPIFAAHLGPHFEVRSLIHFSKMEPIVAYSLSHCFLMDLATIAEMAARYLADSAQAESNAKRKVVSLDMLLPPLHSCNTVPVPPISMLLRGFETSTEFISKRSEPNIEIRWDTGRCHSEASKPCIRQSPGQIFILNTHSKRRQKSPKVASAVPENIVNNGKQNRAILHGVGVWRDGKLYSSSLVSSSGAPRRSDRRWELREQSIRYLLMIYSIIYSVMYSIIYSRIPMRGNFQAIPIRWC